MTAEMRGSACARCGTRPTLAGRAKAIGLARPRRQSSYFIIIARALPRHSAAAAAYDAGFFLLMAYDMPLRLRAADFSRAF